MSNPIDRRSFIQKAAIAGTGLLATTPTGTIGQTAFKRKGDQADSIKVGIIGAGLRGQNHINVLLNRSDCIIPAICDIDAEMLKRSLAIFEKKGQAAPKVYDTSDTAYLDMLESETLDAVIIATPWIWHTPMAIAAMQAGV